MHVYVLECANIILVLKMHAFIFSSLNYTYCNNDPNINNIFAKAVPRGLAVIMWHTHADFFFQYLLDNVRIHVFHINEVCIIRKYVLLKFG